MLREFVNGPLAEATEVIGHNVGRFDVPWIRGRCFIHGIQMSPKLVEIDTLKKARQKFRLPSNRLDYLGECAIGERKLSAGLPLWHAIQQDNCARAMKKMVLYCKQDVRLLEKVFDRMQPYLEPVTSIAEYAQDCAECGGSRTRIKSSHTTQYGALRVQKYCLDCKRSQQMSQAQWDHNKKFATA